MEGFFYKEESRKPIKNRTIKIPENGCNNCKLNNEDLKHPKLKPYGTFQKKILCIGEAPGEKEDHYGKPFHYKAKAGKVLHNAFEEIGLNLYRDCKIINCCDCRPPNNRKPTKQEIRNCWNRKIKAIKKYKPDIILLIGETAISSFYSLDVDRSSFSNINLSSWNGKVVKDKNTGAWIYHIYHPSFIIRGKEKYFDIYVKYLRKIKELVGSKPTFEEEPKIETSTKFNVIKRYLEIILKTKAEFSYDYETSSYRYQEDIHELYLISITLLYGDYLASYAYNTFVFPINFHEWNRWEKREIKRLWKEILEDKKIKKIAQNIKHESQASYYLLDSETKGLKFDTMVASHILDEAKGVTGLKFQTFLNYGIYDYSTEVEPFLKAGIGEKNKLKTLDINKGMKYCGFDSYYTHRLAIQKKAEIKKHSLTKAYNLFHTGIKAFTDIERNGIKIDVNLASKMKEGWDEEIIELKEKILNSKEARKFEKIKGRKLIYKKKLSDTDLRILLFDILKIEPIKTTDKGNHSVDEESLKKISKKYQLEILDSELKVRKLEKMSGTYLNQFLKYEVDGFIYPTFNLHIPRSFRSSSSEPNFQNIPKHVEEAKIIRKIVISRFGKIGWIAEVDYGSMEVRIIACVTKDPVLIEYIIKGKDMHGDWCHVIFKKIINNRKEKRFKELRYNVKNGFIFPNFYGSFFKQTAINLWAGLKKRERKEWKSYTIFENHIKECENKFWKMFKKVRQWQDRSIKTYFKNGYIKDQAWGFIRRGYLDRNKIYNFPIQGPAYHCLQWTINELWKQNYYNLNSLLCGQIHDAIFWDCYKKEFKTLKKKVDYLMTEKIRDENPWIIVPLKTEWEVGDNWMEMEEVK